MTAEQITLQGSWYRYIIRTKTTPVGVEMAIHNWRHHAAFDMFVVAIYFRSIVLDQ